MHIRLLAGTACLVLALSACGGPDGREGTPTAAAPSTSAATSAPTPSTPPATPTSTPEPAAPPAAPSDAPPDATPGPTAAAPASPPAAPGTREAPLAPGRSGTVGDGSPWTVTLVSSDLDAAGSIVAADELAPRPAPGETFVVGTFSVRVDAGALAARGVDLAEEGADPWVDLTVEFVAPDGRVLDATSGTGCYTQNMLDSQGTVYEDGEVVTGDVCVAVPSAAVAGGLWRVSDPAGGTLWLAAR